MKKFLFLSIYFCCTILLSLIIGEFVVRNIPNPYKVKNDWMLNNADKVSTIFLGSSHTYYGIKPEYVDSSYNLANTSQNLKYDYFMLERYGSKCANLKTVVLPISYFTLFTHGFEDTKEWWMAINYKLYMGCSYHSNISKYNAELFHLSVYLGKIKSFLIGKSGIQCDSLGWGMGFTLACKNKRWDKDVATLAVQRHTIKDWSFFKTNYAYLKNIVTFCKQRNVRLVLITTPTWYTYYQHLEGKQLDKMYKAIESIPNIEYYNYLQDNRFIEEDFYDSDHLSDIGAAKFTQLLRDEVLKK